MEPTLSAVNLVRNFGTRHAVEGVSITLNRGEVLGLLGPNGAGKTTTMQMVTGNLAPTAGEIRICGLDLLEEPTRAKMRVGYLPETPPLYRDFSVDEYLELAARLHRLPRTRTAEAVARAKKRCGLADMGNRLIGTLSKGYQQRVGIAQAIVHDPDVVVLDEPTVGLDPNQIREIRTLIRELAAEHSVILSTHILPEVESVCDRVQILNAGRVVYTDTIAALKQHRGGHALTVAFRRPPEIGQLAALPGVKNVEHLGDRLFRIFHDLDSDPTDSLVRQSVEMNWGLRELTPVETSLEEVFVNLTQREDDVAAGADT
ncbi:MAG: ATP-binding cassette domain-containing protein [Betaproteobacteria bacterium]|nr:ATP-binding cassette domain-containing protein [Betaproteobacteria bacterium]